MSPARTFCVPAEEKLDFVDFMVVDANCCYILLLCNLVELYCNNAWLSSCEISYTTNLGIFRI